MTENNEFVEIINAGSGMSYNELKELHNMSMTTLNNMSKIIPSLPSTTTSTTTSTLLCSSKDVKISKSNNNWLIPYLPYKEGCLICKYYEHSLKNCPNVRAEFRGGNWCINCWETGHNSNECRNEVKPIPFNDAFQSSEEILYSLIYK
jgi:hypothetical protein